MKSFFLTLAASALLALVAGQARATVVFEENFNSYTSATALTGKTNANGNSWTTVGGGSHNVVASGFSGNGASAVASGNYNAILHGVDFSSLVAGDHIVVSAKVNANGFSQIDFFGASPLVNFALEVARNFGGAGGFRLEGSYGTHGGFSAANNPVAGWYELKLDWTIGGTADFSATRLSDNTLFSVATVTPTHSPTAFTSIRFFSNTTGGTPTVDDLRIEVQTVPVPEPSSLVLGGFGLMAMVGLVYRKRTRAK